MKKALVTGATSGIGLEICRLLIDKGYFVYGMGRSFERCSFGESFQAVKVDFLKSDDVVREVKKIRNNYIDLVINCAGVGYFGLHEELSPGKIHDIVAVDIEAPMVITSLLLRGLKKTGGRIINISSVTAKKSSPHGAAYGAAKAALSAFSESIADEGRKYGVFVTAIHPDITRTDFYDNAPFEGAEGEEYALSAKDVAGAVEYVLSVDFPVRDITIMPKKHGIKYKK